MDSISLQPVLDAAVASVHACQLGASACKDPISQPQSPPPLSEPLRRSAAASILYGLGIFPGRESERVSWIDALQAFQNPETGLCGTSPDTTLWESAATAATLDLFDQRLIHPPHALLALCSPANLSDFLSRQDWGRHPDHACRNTAAVFSVLTHSGEVGHLWENAYFRWLREETDEHTGLLRRDCLSPMEVDGQWTLLPYLCAYHQILCTYVHARQPHPLPWRLIDTALEVMEYHRDLFCHSFSQRHLPWIFCLTRSLRLSPHRHEEVIHTLERFVPRYVSFLDDQIAKGHFVDLLHVRNSIAALAELQIALPGRLSSRRPLRQILDRISFL
jgi:hypothetical protein